MELVSVQSSQISAIGHDGKSTLHILFKRGGLYEYGDVSIYEYNEMLTAESVGSVFAKKIKGVKTYRRLEEKPWPKDPAPAQPTPEPLPAAATSEPDPKVEQVSKQSIELVTTAKAFTIQNAAEQEQASELLLTVAQMRKQIADIFKPMKDAAFKAHRVICDQEKSLDTPLLEAERALKGEIGGFVAEQQRLAREAEEAARRLAREEADRVAREEADRLAIDDALSLEAEGRAEEAEAVLNNPLSVAPRYVAPAPVVPQVAQVSGISMRKVWKYRILDDSLIPREYLMVNDSAIGAVVSRTNGKIGIPGVEVYEVQQVSARRRA